MEPSIDLSQVVQFFKAMAAVDILPDNDFEQKCQDKAAANPSNEGTLFDPMRRKSRIMG